MTSNVARMTRDEQYDLDIEAVAQVLREYQNPDGHASIQITVRNGVVQLIEDTKKRKPPTSRA